MKAWHFIAIAAAVLGLWLFYRQRQAEAPADGATSAGAMTSIVANPPKPGSGSSLTSLAGSWGGTALDGLLTAGPKGAVSALGARAASDPKGAFEAGMKLNPISLQARATLGVLNKIPGVKTVTGALTSAGSKLKFW